MPLCVIGLLHQALGVFSIKLCLPCRVQALAFDSSLITPGMNELTWAQTEAAPPMNCSVSWCEQMSQLLCAGARWGYSLHICPWGECGVSTCCVESSNQPAIWKGNGSWPIGPLKPFELFCCWGGPRGPWQHLGEKDISRESAHTRCWSSCRGSNYFWPVVSEFCSHESLGSGRSVVYYQE